MKNVELRYTDSELYALESLNHIKKILSQTKDNYILLGLLLIEAKSYFKNIPGKDYKNFKVFAKTEFGLSATTMKDYVRVYERFGEQQSLKEKFKQYNYTQLRELSKLKDEQIDLANPLMTPEEIKSLRKFSASNENEILDSFITTPPSFVETYFKNKDERLYFLNEYTKWELFKQIPDLTLRFFRIQLTDETYLIATETEYFLNKEDPMKHVEFSFLNPKDKFSRYKMYGMTRNTIVDHLTRNKLGYYKIVQIEL